MSELHRLLWETRFSVVAQLVHYRLRAADVWTVLPRPLGAISAPRDRSTLPRIQL